MIPVSIKQMICWRRLEVSIEEFSLQGKIPEFLRLLWSGILDGIALKTRWLLSDINSKRVDVFRRSLGRTAEERREIYWYHFITFHVRLRNYGSAGYDLLEGEGWYDLRGILTPRKEREPSRHQMHRTCWNLWGAPSLARRHWPYCLIGEAADVTELQFSTRMSWLKRMVPLNRGLIKCTGTK